MISSKIILKRTLYQKAAQVLDQQSKDAKIDKEIEQRKKVADASLAEANVGYTNAQAKNTMDDNARQLAVSIDKHFQEWADMTIKATKEGATLPEHPSYDQVLMLARQLIMGQPEPQQQEMTQQDGQVPQDS